jgi:hypothetical protein
VAARYNPGMESDRAQLSALASTLDDLSRRIAEIAGRYRGTPREDVTQGLDDVERSLRSADRQLAKVMRTMRQ